MKLPKVKHRQLAIRFASGRFPQVSTTATEEKFGSKARQHVEMLKVNLRRYEMDSQETCDTEKALEGLLFFSKTVILDMQNKEDLY